MISGGPSGSTSGDPRDTYLVLRTRALPAGLWFELVPFDLCRGRYFALFVNGIWTGKNYRAPLEGTISDLIPVDTSESLSVSALEVGDWETFIDIPDALAGYLDSLSASKLKIAWTAGYGTFAAAGDTQLAAISVSGAQRGANVGDVPEQPTRGRLFYTITDLGATCIVRFYAGGKLVSESAPLTTAGLVAGTAAEVDGSGLTVSFNLTFTGAVALGTAFFDVFWPAAFPIHYSTATLTYPRAAEATVLDNGQADRVYSTPVLAPGTYNYNALQRSDEGVVQTSIVAPADSPQTIYSSPAAPTITGVTIVGGNFIVAWTVGEAGCTFIVYSSGANRPINFGQCSSPAPVGPSAVNATSANAGSVPTTTPVDNTADYASIVANFDAVVAALNTAFDLGEGDFTSIDGTVAGLLIYVAAYEVALGKALQEFKDAIQNSGDALFAAQQLYFGAGLSTDDWRAAIKPYLGAFFGVLGNLVAGEPNRYTFSDGSLPSVGANVLSATLFDVAQPFVKPAIFRFIVRATKGGVQELGDQVFELEVDGAGVTQAARPNLATIQALSFAATVGTITVGVLEDNSAVVATAVELLVNGSVAALNDPNSELLVSFGLTAGIATLVSDFQTGVGVGDWVTVTFDAPYAALSGTYAVTAVVSMTSFRIAISHANIASPGGTGTIQVVAKALGALVDNAHKADLVYNFGAGGEFAIAVRAISAAGMKSAHASPDPARAIFVTGAAPGGVAAIAAQVIRGRGA